MLSSMSAKIVFAKSGDIEVFDYNSLARYNPATDESIMNSRDEFGTYYRSYLYRLLDGSTTSFTLYLNFYTETVYTPNGTDVSLPSGSDPTEYLVIKYLNDLPTNVKNDITTRNSTDYNLIQTNGVPTTGYNCHSYAWYNQGILSNDVWINFPTAYYIDDSYETVTSPRIGDIVCYYDNNGTSTENDDINLHSGIIVGLSGEVSNYNCGDVNMYIVESKWGMGGLYTHKGDECPYTINHSGDADYVKYYRPRTTDAYNLSQFSSTETITLSLNGLSSDICEKYGMYELNVDYQKIYQINVASSYPLDVRLYDEHMQLLINNPVNTYSSETYIVSINPNLSVGRYYLRVAYQNTSNSGNATVEIVGHTHLYTNSYTWLNYNQHRAYCVCGSNRVEVHAVAAKSLSNDLEYLTCILCGGPARAGIVPWDKALKITKNGSFLSPYGILVLVDEDINSFIAGELVFEHENIEVSKSINIPPYLLKKEEDNLI